MEQKEVIHFTRYTCDLCGREYDTASEARTCASDCTLIISRVKIGDIIMRRKSMIREFSFVRDIYNGRPVGTSILFNHQFIDILDTMFNTPSLTGERISAEKFKEYLERLRITAHEIKDGLIEEVSRAPVGEGHKKLPERIDAHTDQK